MSLVGSLEDLGLGDILQIVSLSRKSGLLLLRSEEGDGRIVFCDGLIRAAFVKGEAEDLRGLLVSGDFLDAETFDRAAATAAGHGDSIGDVLAQTEDFSRERLDSLRREQVERSVFRMFSWKVGEFSFEIRDEIDVRDRELMLTTGINAQYLTMEATRLGDEFAKEGDDDIHFGTVDDADGLVDSAPAEDDLAFDIPDDEVPADADRVDSDDTEPEVAGIADAVAAAEHLALATVERLEAADPETAADSASASPPECGPEPEVPSTSRRFATLASLVIIDPNLAALEWQKSVLGPICKRIHIFQHADNGIARIRQYLRRGEEPFVLVSNDVPSDPRSGIGSPTELIRRLRAHAPRMALFLMQSGNSDAPAEMGDGCGLLRRPANHEIANPRNWERLEPAGAELREVLGRSAVPECPVVSPTDAEPEEPPTVEMAAERFSAAGLRRLKTMSDRLRDPSVRGEVLSLILEFAAESFSRVAIFMVRDDEAVGMAQAGLERAEGPGDEAFREIVIPVREPSWFRNVLDRREGLKAGPSDAGDRQLAALLGSSVPNQAYVAPIESSHRVVALVYVDNLPDDAPIGETASLEIFLHEAGLALERALLERALADASGRADV
jgi:hypothetical protein